MNLTEAIRTLMPRCRDVARLQSNAIDRRLPLGKRVGLRLHLLACRWCRRYGKQIRFLHQSAHEHAENLTETAPHTLSSEARDRLKRSLRAEEDTFRNL
jgi:hypothetical protein